MGNHKLPSINRSLISNGPKSKKDDTEKFVDWIDDLKSRFSSTLISQDAQTSRLEQEFNHDELRQYYKTKLFIPDLGEPDLNLKELKELEQEELEQEELEQEELVLEQEESQLELEQEIQHSDDVVEILSESEEEAPQYKVLNGRPRLSTVEYTSARFLESEVSDVEIIEEEEQEEEEQDEQEEEDEEEDEEEEEEDEVEDEEEQEVEVDEQEEGEEEDLDEQKQQEIDQNNDLKLHFYDPLIDEETQSQQSYVSSKQESINQFYNLENRQFDFSKPVDNQKLPHLPQMEMAEIDPELHQQIEEMAQREINDIEEGAVDQFLVDLVRQNHMDPRLNVSQILDTSETVGDELSDSTIDVGKGGEDSPIAPLPQPFEIIDGSLIAVDMDTVSEGSEADTEGFVTPLQHSETGEAESDTEAQKMAQVTDSEEEDTVVPDVDAESESDTHSIHGSSFPIFKSLEPELPEETIRKLKLTEEKYGIKLKVRKDLQIENGIDPVQEYIEGFKSLGRPTLDDVPSGSELESEPEPVKAESESEQTGIESQDPDMLIDQNEDIQTNISIPGTPQQSYDIPEIIISPSQDDDDRMQLDSVSDSPEPILADARETEAEPEVPSDMDVDTDSPEPISEHISDNKPDTTSSNFIGIQPPSLDRIDTSAVDLTVDDTEETFSKDLNSSFAPEIEPYDIEPPHNIEPPHDIEPPQLQDINTSMDQDDLLDQDEGTQLFSAPIPQPFTIEAPVPEPFVMEPTSKDVPDIERPTLEDINTSAINVSYMEDILISEEDVLKDPEGQELQESFDGKPANAGDIEELSITEERATDDTLQPSEQVEQMEEDEEQVGDSIGAEPIGQVEQGEAKQTEVEQQVEPIEVEQAEAKETEVREIDQGQKQEQERAEQLTKAADVEENEEAKQTVEVGDEHEQVPEVKEDEEEHHSSEKAEQVEQFEKDEQIEEIEQEEQIEQVELQEEREASAEELENQQSDPKQGYERIVEQSETVQIEQVKEIHEDPEASVDLDYKHDIPNPILEDIDSSTFDTSSSGQDMPESDNESSPNEEKVEAVVSTPEAENQSMEYPEFVEVTLEGDQVIHPSAEIEPLSPIVSTEPQESDHLFIYEAFSRGSSYEGEVIRPTSITEALFEEPRFKVEEESDINEEEKMVDPSDIGRPQDIKRTGSILRFEITEDLAKSDSLDESLENGNNGTEEVGQIAGGEVDPSDKDPQSINEKSEAQSSPDETLLPPTEIDEELDKTPAPDQEKVDETQSDNLHENPPQISLSKKRNLDDGDDESEPVFKKSKPSPVSLNPFLWIRSWFVKPKFSPAPLDESGEVSDKKMDQTENSEQDQGNIEDPKNLSKTPGLGPQSFGKEDLTSQQNLEPHDNDSEASTIEAMDVDKDSQVVGLSDDSKQENEQDNESGPETKTELGVENEIKTEPKIETKNESDIDTDSDAEEKKPEPVDEMKDEKESTPETKNGSVKDEFNEILSKEIPKSPKTTKILGLEVDPTILEPAHSLRDGHSFGKSPDALAPPFQSEPPTRRSGRNRKKSQKAVTPPEVQKPKKVTKPRGSPKKAPKKQKQKLDTKLEAKSLDHPASRTRSKSPLKESLRDIITEEGTKKARRRKSKKAKVTPEEAENDENRRGRPRSRD